MLGSAQAASSSLPRPAMTADALVLVGARLAASAPVALTTRQCFRSTLGPLGHHYHLAMRL